MTDELVKKQKAKLLYDEIQYYQAAVSATNGLVQSSISNALAEKNNLLSSMEIQIERNPININQEILSMLIDQFNTVG